MSRPGRESSPPVTVRRCGPADSAALALVGQATFLETFAGIIAGQDIVAHCQRQHSPEKYARWLEDPATAVWLAEVDPGQAPVGFLVLARPDLPLADIGPRDLEVKRIYLLGRFRGNGLGSRLMQLARDEAQGRGAPRLLLGVYSGNATAIAFYERHGYRRAGERRFQVGDRWYDDFVFALPLAAVTNSAVS